MCFYLSQRVFSFVFFVISFRCVGGELRIALWWKEKMLLNEFLKTFVGFRGVWVCAADVFLWSFSRQNHQFICDGKLHSERREAGKSNRYPRLCAVTKIFVLIRIFFNFFEYRYSKKFNLKIDQKNIKRNFRFGHELKKLCVCVCVGEESTCDHYRFFFTYLLLTVIYFFATSHLSIRTIVSTLECLLREKKINVSGLLEGRRCSESKVQWKVHFCVLMVRKIIFMVFEIFPS